ncbi:MAG: glycosyl hydrolase family 8 [Polyangiaceae bacterium]|jgi:endoglucanase
MSSTSCRIGIASCAALLPLIVATPSFAQSHPFPTSAHYAQGFIPPAATAAVAQSSYDSWKSKYLLNDCGNGYYRVDNATGDASTFSEGQGYGMVLTAYFGDKTQFDGLWSFAQKNYNSNGLMGWHVTCSGFTTSDGGSGSATDGDTDIGFALIVAAAQWGGTYEATAKTYLATLKSVEFTTCSPTGRNMPNAGNWDTNNGVGGGCTASNTSYWMPGYYRVFQQITGDAYWGKAADDIVDLYNLAANPSTGIIVNEVDQNGVAVSGQTYDYNSCRIPWRAVLDYLWNGTAGAAAETTKITNWANSVGIMNIVDGYDANGTATGMYTGLNEWVGGFTAGAMSNSQTMVNSFANYFVSIANDNGTYYGASLRTLYLLELSGNEWNPLTVGGLGPGVIGGVEAGSPPTSDSGPGDEDGQASASGGGPGDSDGSPTGAETDGGVSNGATPGGHTSSSSGCGCKVAPRESGEAAGVALFSLLALCARRRRR